jgi:hypothetical protein
MPKTTLPALAGFLTGTGGSLLEELSLEGNLMLGYVKSKDSEGKQSLGLCFDAVGNHTGLKRLDVRSCGFVTTSQEMFQRALYKSISLTIVKM